MSEVIRHFGKDKGPKAPKGYEAVSLDEVEEGNYVIVEVEIDLGRNFQRVVRTFTGKVVGLISENGENIGLKIEEEDGKVWPVSKGEPKKTIIAIFRRKKGKAPNHL